MTKRTSHVLGLTALLISLLLAMGAGCGGSGSEQPVLDATSWELTSWAEPNPVPASATITAEFGDGRVTGTKMAGPQDAMAAETAYLTRLQAATSYRMDGDTLVINDADGQSSLIFTPISVMGRHPEG